MKDLIARQRRPWRPIWLLTLLLLVDCRGCRPVAPTRPLLALAGEDAAAALWTADLAALGRGLDAFLAGALGDGRAAGLWTRLLASLATRLGFDPLNPDTYAAAGLPAHPEMLWLWPTEVQAAPLLSLTVANATRFDAALRGALEGQEGKLELSEELIGGQRLQRLGRPFGTAVAPLLTWTHFGGHALLASAAAHDLLLAALQRLAAPATRDLADLVPLQTALANLAPAPLHLWLRAPPAPPALAAQDDRPAAQDGLLVGLGLGAQGLNLEALLPVADLAALAPPPAAPPLAELLARVPARAPLALLARGAQPSALASLQALPAAAPMLASLLASCQRALGCDCATQLLPHLSGPVVLSLAPRALADLLTLRRVTRGPAAAALLRLQLLANVASQAQAEALVGRLEAAQASAGNCHWSAVGAALHAGCGVPGDDTGDGGISAPPPASAPALPMDKVNPVGAAAGPANRLPADAWATLLLRLGALAELLQADLGAGYGSDVGALLQRGAMAETRAIMQRLGDVLLTVQPAPRALRLNLQVQLP